MFSFFHSGTISVGEIQQTNLGNLLKLTKTAFLELNTANHLFSSSARIIFGEAITCFSECKIKSIKEYDKTLVGAIFCALIDHDGRFNQSSYLSPDTITALRMIDNNHLGIKLFLQDRIEKYGSYLLDNEETPFCGALPPIMAKTLYFIGADHFDTYINKPTPQIKLNILYQLTSALYDLTASTKFCDESKCIFLQARNYLLRFPPKNKAQYDQFLIGTILCGLVTQDWKYRDNNNVPKLLSQETNETLTGILNFFDHSPSDIECIKKFGFNALFDKNFEFDGNLPESVRKSFHFIPINYFKDYCDQKIMDKNRIASTWNGRSFR